ncbi:MAG: hypothetical protein ACREAU_00600 [Nitrosopumilaceae archaeon]
MSQVKATIIEAIKEHIRVSLEFRKKIDEAKTSVSKEYYQRKLTENNKQAADLLIALDKLNQSTNNVSNSTRGTIAPSQLLQLATEHHRQPS